MELVIQVLVNVSSGMISFVLCSVLHNKKDSKKM